MPSAPARGETPARPPFAHLAPALALAATYGVAALLWALAGDALPGGRWLAVHLFTLGVVSNLVLVLTVHFSATITHAPTDGATWLRLALFNAGTLALLAGLHHDARAAFLLGALGTTAAVAWLLAALIRMRRRALGARFAFVVRAYEHGAAAFLLAGVLGALLGAGDLAGPWHGGVRLAHLTAGTLGWAGLVLLATVVFFGPTVLRTRIAPQASRLAVPALRTAAAALLVGVAALALGGAEDAAGRLADVVAALALAGYALAATAVCAPVVQVAYRTERDAHGLMLAASCVWFPAAAWIGVVALASGSAGLLDAVGRIALVGVLAQAILGSWSYLLPMAVGVGPAARALARRRLARLGRARPAALNLGVLLLALASVPATGPALATPLATTAWALIVAAVALTLALALSALHGVLREARPPPARPSPRPRDEEHDDAR